MAIHHPKSISTNNNITFVIMCSHAGYRMKSWGNRSLLQLKNGQTVLQHNISIINKFFPNASIIVTCGFESERFTRHETEGARVVESHYYKFTNCIEECRLAIKNMPTLNRMFFMYGDILITKDVFKNYTEDSYIILDKHQMQDYEVSAITVDDKLTNLSYGANDKWTGMVQLTGNTLNRFSAFCNNDNSAKFMFEGINYTIKRGSEINCVYNNSFLKKITEPSHVEEIKKCVF